MSAPAVYTVDEAAEATGMSAQALRAAIRRGDIPAERRGRRWLLARATVEGLRGGRLPANHKPTGGQQIMTDTLTKLARDWPLGRRDLTEAELADFVAAWNADLAPLGREDLEARGFAVVTGPAVAHLDWPLGDAPNAHHCLITIRAVDGRWNPMAAVNADRAGDILERLADGLGEIQQLANRGEPYKKIAARAFELNDAAIGASVLADNATDRLARIPEDAELEGCMLIYEPEGIAA